MRTRRRAFLATCGAVLGGTAGCLGDGGGGSSTPVDVDDENPDDGYAPDAVLPDDEPDAVDFDPASFDTVETGGVEVSLVPVQTAYNWFQREDARFADARGSTQYQRNHVPGAVHSPAPDGGGAENDPVTDWPDDARIVTYCGCPHHLSSQRAATLIDGGRDAVFAIDEGFRRDNGGWLEQGYPVAGNGGSSQAYVVSGQTNPADDGGYARAEYGDGSQIEAAPIQADGSYEMTLHFSGLTPDSLLTIQTPSYEVTQSLAEVTEGLVTGE